MSKDEILAHYVMLASAPGWKLYVWKRVNDMAKEAPDLWGDLPQKLTEAMKAKKDEQR